MVNPATGIFKSWKNLSKFVALTKYQNHIVTHKRTFYQQIRSIFNKKTIGIGFQKLPFIRKMTQWIQFGDLEVCTWTLSGVESCVVVKGPNLNIAFDMGYALKEAVNCQHVFISHGHMDHIAGLHSHASKRSLLNLKPATYHVLPHLVDPLDIIGKQFAQINETDDTMAKLNLNPVTSEGSCDQIRLPHKYYVRPFPTKHRVQSQGYLLYQVRRPLKEEYKGKSDTEIQALIKEGVEVKDTKTTPLLAYTGDTTFDLYQSPPNPDLLKVKLLITESTYIDDETRKGQNGVQRARTRGHSHLREFVDNKELFKDVDNILLVHFSDKYSPRYITKRMDELVPEELKDKIHLGVQPFMFSKS